MNEVEITELNEEDLINIISILTGIDSSELTIGTEVNEQGHIIRINIYVKDSAQAAVIADAVNEIKKGEGCAYGVLCEANSVKIKRIASGLSSGNRMKQDFVIIFITMFSFIAMLNQQ